MHYVWKKFQFQLPIISLFTLILQLISSEVTYSHTFDYATSFDTYGQFVYLPIYGRHPLSCPAECGNGFKTKPS